MHLLPQLIAPGGPRPRNRVRLGRLARLVVALVMLGGLLAPVSEPSLLAQEEEFSAATGDINPSAPEGAPTSDVPAPGTEPVGPLTDETAFPYQELQSGAADSETAPPEPQPYEPSLAAEPPEWPEATEAGQAHAEPPTATPRPFQSRTSSSSSASGGQPSRQSNRGSQNRQNAQPAATPTPTATPMPTVGSTSPAAVAAPRVTTVRRGGRELLSTTFEEELAPDGRPMRAGSLLVQFRSSASQSARDSAHRDAAVVAVEPLRQAQSVRVQVPRGEVEKSLQAYRARGDVERVEPDYVLRALSTPNDPRYGEQYGLPRIAAPAAWDQTHSSSSVRVAILDCGIYSSSSTYIGPDGQPGHADVRGKVVLEQNFTTSPNGADDYCNHGTHVAGIAAASTNNATGVAGVGYDAAIINGKVLDDTGSGSTAWIANGIRWAADNGAKVINMSLGGSGSCSFTFQSAIDYAWSRGVVIVAAAGNSNLNGASQPANCNHVIAVAATDQNDGRASFSNYGANVDVAAPGVGILSSDFVGSYASFSGTSMASPHVAGLAALVWSTSHGTSNQAVMDRIMATADQIAGTGSLWTAGRVNAGTAVSGSGPAPTATRTPTATPTRTPTNGPTSTPVPSPCAPRPNVVVSAVPAGAGRLQVTVTSGNPAVRLRELRFGAATNAQIDAGSTLGANGGFTVSLTPASQQTSFVVRRAIDGQATHVPLVVVDDCGQWPTFVGGGPNAF